MSDRFRNKVVLVTGGTSGIGLATARAFVDEGADVIITGRRQEPLDSAVRELGAGVTAIRADVSRLEDLDALYARIAEAHGHVDILFANAGGGTFGALGAITEAEFDATFATNVKGTLFTVQKALPLMRAGGAIILTASTTSISGTPAFSVYSATKAAIRSFARNWILDVKDRGIRINAISPGVTDTAGLDDLFGGGASADGIKQGLAQMIPAGRIGRPEEIARAVLFLASEEASFVNGVELFVDGGQAHI